MFASGDDGMKNLDLQDSSPMDSIAYMDEKKAPNREEWVKQQLRARAAQYIETKKFTVVVGSWNVNSKVPERGLDEWLRFDLNPDIIAIGLQEIDMTAKAMVKQETAASDSWLAALEKELQNAKFKYKRLVAKQMVGIYIAVFIKQNYEKMVIDPRFELVPTGAMKGTIGNKGAIGFRCQISETTFCFVAAHLAAHKKETEKRNQNFSEIMKKMNFSGGSNFYPEKHDYFFWFGDLNYRIDGLSDEEVKKKCREKKIKELLKYDQLVNEKAAGRVFFGFEEGPIQFLPTYKYDPGTLNFDSSEKQRPPAWCDRVLWKGAKKDKCKLISYNSYEVLISDHLPVSAAFHCDVLTVVEYKYREVFQKLMKEYAQQYQGKKAAMNDEVPPLVELNKDTFSIPQVCFNVPVEQILEIKNLTKAVVEYNFVAKPMEDSVCKPWLKLSTQFGLIPPGGQADIKITIFVDRQTAPDLNASDGILDDQLVVHIEHGKDYTVNIKGSFLKSCFGNSLTNLVCYFEPVRYMKAATFQRIRNSNSIAKPAIPKELWIMVDYILKYGIREESIFQEIGVPAEVKQLREKLDCGESLTDFPGSIHSVIECLMTFLESLAEPVIPTKFYRKCIESAGNKIKIEEIIDSMPNVHYNTFHYLMAFLREVLANCDANNLNPDGIASGFAHLIIPSPAYFDPAQREQDHAAKITILKMFLYEDVEWGKKDDAHLFKPVK